MKRNLLHVGVSVLAAMMLVACGSGGGNNSPSEEQVKPVQPAAPVQPNAPSTEQTQATTPSTQPVQPVKPIQPMNPVAPSAKPTQPISPAETPLKGTGGVFVVNDGDDEITYKKAILDSSDLTKIDVERKTIPLIKDYQKSINSTVKLFNQEDGYRNTRFGVVVSHEAGRPDIIFYNGNPTQDMPNEGIVTYKGDSILTDNDDVVNDYIKGTSSFTADFGNKKLNGELNSLNNEEVNVTIKVEAKISGNSFTGSATSSQFAVQGESEGRFYGEHAQELGGMVKANDNSWGGSFGAKKQ